jgi:two-component system, LytTR family, sensor kinase
MKKSVIALLHFGFWACYIILVIIILVVYGRSAVNVLDQEARTLNALKSLFFFAFLPSATSYFLYYFVLFPKYLQQKKYFLSIVFGILISVAIALFSYILMRYLIENGRLIDMDQGGNNGRSTALKAIIVSTFIGVICGTVALVIQGFINWFNEMKQKEMLKERNHEMELALIKSQLDPHLLFNSINNIDSLILKDPAKASNYLNKLSDIMRFMLYETKVEKILLSKEIEYIEKYIALQKIRTANTSYVSFLVTGIMGNKYVAPMIFIPFIENAFKHSNNKKLQNAISINILIEDDTIQMICENKFDPKIKDEYTIGGLGNELIKSRLELIYPDKHTLDVKKNIDNYCVKLIIKIK